MNLVQALRYFFGEAALNLVRSWKVSLLAVVTIAVSLFVGGAFLLLSGNLAETAEQWRERAQVVIYLDEAADPELLASLAAELESEGWVTEVQRVDSGEAEERFKSYFPGLAGLVDGWGETPLPASLEVRFDPNQGAAMAASLGSLRTRPGVEMVDDERSWLEQLETLIAVVQGVGLTLAIILLGAAVFTIASVVRLTAYLHRDEISIMRLVGATEFFIRGPFYVEGLLQGLVGGLVAAIGLFVAFRSLLDQGVIGSMISTGFLSVQQIALLVLLGGAAGLVGAVTSLRREDLDTNEAA